MAHVDWIADPYEILDVSPKLIEHTGTKEGLKCPAEAQLKFHQSKAAKKRIDTK